jgi:hypothetical protein
MEWSGRGKAPNDVKAARRLRLALHVAGIAKAERAHRRGKLVGRQDGNRSTTRRGQR